MGRKAVDITVAVLCCENVIFRFISYLRWMTQTRTSTCRYHLSNWSCTITSKRSNSSSCHCSVFLVESRWAKVCSFELPQLITLPYVIFTVACNNRCSSWVDWSHTDISTDWYQHSKFDARIGEIRIRTKSFSSCPLVSMPTYMYVFADAGVADSVAKLATPVERYLEDLENNKMFLLNCRIQRGWHSSWGWDKATV